MHRDSCPLECKVYVGNLGNDGNKTELERAVGYYGPLRSVWVARYPTDFTLVEFEDPPDAADAVREQDGRTLRGCLLRVDLYCARFFFFHAVICNMLCENPWD
uniref:RRM domain-containing protein n=1 Tax=Monodon monoceros TaxID=40151 RepID=A0A8C6CCF8_MONMO